MTPAPRMVSRYTPLHALAAGAVLLFTVFAKGPAFFWQQFVHGLAPQPLTPHTLLLNLVASFALFGTLTLVLWITTLFRKPTVSVPAPDRLAAVKHAVRWFPVILAVALTLSGACSTLMEWFTGVKAADQELVKCVLDGSYSRPLRLLMFAAILFEAPLIEEPLFRGVIYRGLLPALPPWAAMCLSSFVFAILHVNAATFIPLFFLGCAFTELYRRTGSLLAPMTAHFLFNAANLLGLFLFPD